jgi:hypothetical protein
MIKAILLIPMMILLTGNPDPNPPLKPPIESTKTDQPNPMHEEKRIDLHQGQQVYTRPVFAVV